MSATSFFTGGSNYLDPNDDGQVTNKKLTAQQVKTMHELPLEDVSIMDKLCEEGIDAFFENRVMECENMINANADSDPLSMCGAALLGFLRYALSMEQEQSDRALRLLHESSTFSGQLYSTQSRMLKIFSRHNKDPSSKWLKPAEFRAKTIHAESQALRCFVLVLQQSLASVMKAGIALNHAYGEYNSLQREIEERLAANNGNRDALGIDRNSLYSVDFGLGAINIALSILPDNISAMLRFLGFKGDRDVGLALTRRCLDSGTLLSPFAALLLLAVQGMLPAICQILIPSCLPDATKIGQECLANPKLSNSLIFLWLIGRITRLNREVDESVAKLERCLEGAQSKQIRESMPQLAHFALYDQACNMYIKQDWAAAIRYLGLLAKASKWSSMYYLYATACCYEMRVVYESDAAEADTLREYEKKATEFYWLAAHQKVTYLGGKVNRVDQLMAKRLEEILLVNHVAHPNSGHKTKRCDMAVLPEGTVLKNTVPLPMYEQLVLMNLSHQVPRELAQQMVAYMDAALEKEMMQTDSNDMAAQLLVRALSTKSPIEKADSKKIKANAMTTQFGCLEYLTGVKACLLANSPNAEDRIVAENLADIVLSTPRYKDKACSLSYLKPHVLYDTAYIIYEKDGREACQKVLDAYTKEYGSSHYYYHSQVELKVHLAQYVFKAQHKEEEEQLMRIKNAEYLHRTQKKIISTTASEDHSGREN